jgi:hypothetical protein
VRGEGCYVGNPGEEYQRIVPNLFFYAILRSKADNVVRCHYFLIVLKFSNLIIT